VNKGNFPLILQCRQPPAPQLRNDLITCQRTVPTISGFRTWRNQTTIRPGR
jgi:hypothetical protein